MVIEAGWISISIFGEGGGGGDKYCIELFLAGMVQL